MPWCHCSNIPKKRHPIVKWVRKSRDIVCVFLVYGLFLGFGWVCFQCYLQHLGAGTFILHGSRGISQLHVCCLNGVCTMLELQACILRDFGPASLHCGWCLQHAGNMFLFVFCCCCCCCCWCCRCCCGGGGWFCCFCCFCCFNFSFCFCFCFCFCSCFLLFLLCLLCLLFLVCWLGLIFLLVCPLCVGQQSASNLCHLCHGRLAKLTLSVCYLGESLVGRRCSCCLKIWQWRWCSCFVISWGQDGKNNTSAVQFFGLLTASNPLRASCWWQVSMLASRLKFCAQCFIRLRCCQ